MPKILIISLSTHWAVVFAHCALAAAPQFAAPVVAMAAAQATGHALVAALFLWTALAAWAGEDGEGVARLALSVAALVLGAQTILQGPDAMAAIWLAGLAATYLVIRAETAAREEQPAVDWSGEVARRLALAAAHGSMLSRLSRRAPGEGER